MYICIIIFVVLLIWFAVLLKKASQNSHPFIRDLLERGIKPGVSERLLSRGDAYVSAGRLMTVREQRFLHLLDCVVDARKWRLCPQVRVADIVRVSSGLKSGSKEWWQLFRLIAQWHCDIVITDRNGHIVAAVELDDRSHLTLKRQRRDLLLEEVLRQAGIPLLRGIDEQQLAARVRKHLSAHPADCSV